MILADGSGLVKKIPSLGCLIVRRSGLRRSLGETRDAGKQNDSRRATKRHGSRCVRRAPLGLVVEWRFHYYGCAGGLKGDRLKARKCGTRFGGALTWLKTPVEIMARALVRNVI